MDIHARLSFYGHDVRSHYVLKISELIGVHYAQCTYVLTYYAVFYVYAVYNYVYYCKTDVCIIMY